MSKIPAEWEKELSVQRMLRHKIDILQKSQDWWRERKAKVLAQGGRGWVSRVAYINLKMEANWKQLLRVTQRLYERKAVA